MSELLTSNQYLHPGMPEVEWLAILARDDKYASVEFCDVPIQDRRALIAVIKRLAESVTHETSARRFYQVGNPCGVCASGIISSRGGHLVCANCGWYPPGSWTSNTTERGGPSSEGEARADDRGDRATGETGSARPAAPVLSPSLPDETEVPHTAHCVNRIEDIGCDCGSGHKPDCQLATAVCTCGADAPASPVKSTGESHG